MLDSVAGTEENTHLLRPAHPKLGLGTVQFGLPYGIANKLGRISRQEAESVLDLARSSGIDLLDTAVAYGESESLLGEIGVGDFHVVTKLPAVPENERDISGWVEQQVHSSLRRLRLARLYGLLLHAPAQLLEADGAKLSAGLEEMRRQSLVEKIGISIYSPDELEAIFPLFPLGMVQAPLNLVDRRLVETGWLQRLRSEGVEIHVRSVFLQGLLLLSLQEIPHKFARWTPLWEAWHSWLRKTRISPQAACLNFARSFAEIDRVIVGVDGLSQLQDLVGAVNATEPTDWPRIASSDAELVNPSLWNRL